MTTTGEPIFARSVRDCHEQQRVAIVLPGESGFLWGTVSRVAGQYVYVNFDDGTFEALRAGKLVIGGLE